MTDDSTPMPDAPFPAGHPKPNEAPFVVQHRQGHLTTGGNFTPAARLMLMPALRTTGLWNALPPQEMADLVLLLTFLTPNGWIRPTLTELADAMNTSQGAAQARLERLTRRTWQGQPLVIPLPREGASDAFAFSAYAPAPHLLAREQVPHPAGDVPVMSGTTAWEVAGREAVISYSRARYARTRAEVEAEIAERMGWAAPAFADEEPDVAARKRAAYEQMTGYGMGKEQALELLARFDVERVERQAGWMQYRHAKSPARFLAAAIENDYDPPLGLRTPSGEAGERAENE